MYYRSDWPEIGLPTALNKHPPLDPAAQRSGNERWVREVRACGALFRWTAVLSKFESDLYGIPIWNLYLEVEDTPGNLLASWPASPALLEQVSGMVGQMLDARPWETGYVFSKLVEGEPLCDALRHSGFETVEHRRIFMCQVGDLAPEQDPRPPARIHFTSLATLSKERFSASREQILRICQEAFEDRGYSRHFTDPVLLARQPGLVYIMAVMNLNLDHVPPDRILVAIDTSADRVCGFSAIGRKPGLNEAVCTQLLSAVQGAYRRQGVYRGLTRLLASNLSKEVTLLNVVQADNHAIQRAYQGSGRVHLADTQVLRRVYQP